MLFTTSVRSNAFCAAGERHERPVGVDIVKAGFENSRHAQPHDSSGRGPKGVSSPLGTISVTVLADHGSDIFAPAASPE